MRLKRGVEELQARLLQKRRRLADKCMRHFLRDIDLLRQVARVCGYALTVHGTLCRDIDLVACPWVRRALAPRTLHKRLYNVIKHHGRTSRAYTHNRPTRKPHGRLAWSIHLGDGAYIDLSVMPRLT